MKIVKNDLFDYDDRYIYQLEEGFKFSLDSILLAEYVKLKKSDKLLADFCTGNAPIPLIISKKSNIDIIGIEYQKEVFNLAEMSIKENALGKQIKVINDDVKNAEKYFVSESIDVITCNPPYFRYSDEKFLNESNLMKIARHELKLNLEDIFKISNKLLTQKGILYLVHRATRIDEIIILANKYKMNVKEATFIMTKENNVYTVLVKCVRNSKLDIKINVKSIENLKTYKNMF